ncbi:hypothetical protein OG585_34725 [Streptomyces sp. NBC_01340]|uniref:hypothetical protein n=1 Tax=unclassified Streptomyces TaxID=2593676 RepID=UPI00225918DB|nr:MULTISPECIES: hypothetical protein [unclassified Streptomyces]MCX4457729.1 hypothetical protein [Streptomyces sp. NBC_01719]MCX4497086.1 hypothetical protein [Streptomyces sp. NBC_01728]WSI41951.1 hypothetical protein OG585_34725 [Streptomyces sp. NBC_01340]
MTTPPRTTSTLSPTTWAHDSGGLRAARGDELAFGACVYEADVPKALVSVQVKKVQQA